MSGNPYKSLPFPLRMMLLVVLVSALPIWEIYRTSARRRSELRAELAKQSALETQLVEVRGKYDQLVKLRQSVELLEQKLSVYGKSGDPEFQLSDLIKSASDIASQRGIVVDYLQAKDPAPVEGKSDQHDLDIGLVGQFAPVVQFLEQLLKKQQRLSIVDVDVLGNDPFQKYLDMSEDGVLPSVQQLQELSAVRVKATLRIITKI